MVLSRPAEQDCGGPAREVDRHVRFGLAAQLSQETPEPLGIG